MVSLPEIVRYSDDYLRIAEINDYPNALNGLQIENSGMVDKIGAAVDASSATLQAAAERHISFLLVHHGMFCRFATGHRFAASTVEARARK